MGHSIDPLHTLLSNQAQYRKVYTTDLIGLTESINSSHIAPVDVSFSSTSACFGRVSERTAPVAERDQNGTFMV